MNKRPRFIKYALSRCPACGQITLSSYDRGDDCSNCGYNVYYP